MNLELDYKLLEPYSREANEVTLILEKNVRQLINLLKGNDLIIYLDNSLTFWVRLTNVPEDLGLYTDWALVRIQTLLSEDSLTSIGIGFPGHNVLGLWRFEYSKNYPLPLPQEILSEEKDIGDLVIGLQKIFEEIKKDPEKYNRYVENNLPTLYKTGYISVKDYYEICPEESIRLTEEQGQEILGSSPHYIFVDLTLRKFFEIFTKVHSSMTGLDPGKYGGDKEYYENITGVSIDPLYSDIDSPQTLKQFAKGGILRSGIFDLVHSKVCLVPEDLCPYDGYPTKNLWRIYLCILDNNFLSMALKGYLVVKKEVILAREKEIFGILRGQGLIRLSPTPSHNIHNTSVRMDGVKKRADEEIYLDKLYPLDSPEKMEEIEKRVLNFEPLSIGLLYKQKRNG